MIVRRLLFIKLLRIRARKLIVIANTYSQFLFKYFTHIRACRDENDKLLLEGRVYNGSKYSCILYTIYYILYYYIIKSLVFIIDFVIYFIVL